MRLQETTENIDRINNMGIVGYSEDCPIDVCDDCGRLYFKQQYMDGDTPEHPSYDDDEYHCQMCGKTLTDLD